MASTDRNLDKLGHNGPLTYRAAGVDIGAGSALVELIKPAARNTRRPGVFGGLGGFGALFDLRSAGFRDPILVSGADGVGTKLRIAVDTGLHQGIGVDLVAMCVNDLVVQGAEPLFFLDYFATGRLNSSQAESVIGGIAEGCRLAGCALVGGETAEMPGMYASNDYDLAGFAVGAVERDQLLPHDVRVGDEILGLASTGVHSNGFSMARRIIVMSGLSWADPAPYAPEMSLAEAMMIPTRIYVSSLLSLQRAGLLKAAAHITGGGLPGNLPRVLPTGTAAVLDPIWPVPAVFRWLARTGNVSMDEMLRVFNCGLGMVCVVSDGDAARALLTREGELVFKIGTVQSHEGQARVRFAPPLDWLA